MVELTSGSAAGGRAVPGSQRAGPWTSPSLSGANASVLWSRIVASTDRLELGAVPGFAFELSGLQ